MDCKLRLDCREFGWFLLDRPVFIYFFLRFIFLGIACVGIVLNFENSDRDRDPIVEIRLCLLGKFGYDFEICNSFRYLEYWSVLACSYYY